MQQNWRVVVCLMLGALGGCAYTVFAEGDRLQYSLPESEEWRLAYQDFVSAAQGTGGVWIEEYTRPGESVEDWRELVTVMKTYRDFLVSKKDYYDGLVKVREKNCPGSTRWNVVEESDTRLLYEWWSKECMGFAPQHEIATIVDGRRDRFLFRYTNMGAGMDADTREKWKQILLDAEVIVDTK